MNAIELKHILMVSSLVKSAEEILKEQTETKIDLMHAVLGIAGEAGELVDAIKIHTIYNGTLDIENVIEELGDLEFYMEQLRARLGIIRTECLRKNIMKLKERYPNFQYTDARAEERADKISTKEPS